MKVSAIGEYGYVQALFGIGLSYGLTSGMGCFPTIIDEFDEWDVNNGIPNEYKEECALFKRLEKIAMKLALKGNAENKFLRQITVILDIEAPLFWWKEADTYKVGTTAQSESTMHTLMKNPISQGCFEKPIYEPTLKHLEELRQTGDFEQLVNELPSGWLQRRILSCNYAVLQNIYSQRCNHKLKEWHIFCDELISGLEHPDFIVRMYKAS